MNAARTVRYIGCTTEQVNWGSNDDPRGLLVDGHEYTVDHEERHSWHTKIYLVEFPSLAFNSVCFDEVQP